MRSSLLEGWSALAALAVETQRIRIGVMITGNTYRHPAVLANIASTVDVISGGRLEIGIGAGWNQKGHDAYGIYLPPLGERFDRLNEALAVLDGLLTAETMTIFGRHYQLNNARCEPKPIQKPRPPFVIGGLGEKRTLRIAAKWADHWNFPHGSPPELKWKIGVLESHCAEIGRDPD